MEGAINKRVRSANGKWYYAEVPKEVWEAALKADKWMQTNNVIHLGPLRRYPSHDV